MLHDAYGCEDGFTSRHYKKGDMYEIEDHLAKNFVIAELAEYVEEKSKQSHENKALTDDDYQNKSDKLNRRERK